MKLRPRLSPTLDRFLGGHFLGPFFVCLAAFTAAYLLGDLFDRFSFDPEGNGQSGDLDGGRGLWPPSNHPCGSKCIDELLGDSPGLRGLEPTRLFGDAGPTKHARHGPRPR